MVLQPQSISMEHPLTSESIKLSLNLQLLQNLMNNRYIVFSPCLFPFRLYKVDGTAFIFRELKQHLSGFANVISKSTIITRWLAWAL